MILSTTYLELKMNLHKGIRITGFVGMFAGMGLLLSCQGSHKGSEERSEITIAEMSEEIKVPSQLWDIVEGEGDSGKVSVKEASGGHGGGASKEGSSTDHSGGNSSTKIAKEKDKAISYIFTSLSVNLDEKNEQVLSQPRLSLHLPRGGGTIDLAELVGAKNGTFYVQFTLPEELKNSKDLKVHFVSRTKKRKMGEEIVGGGCQSFFDISPSFEKTFVNSGFPVNTTRDRHLSVLGGTFVISLVKDNQIYISQVSFTDSRKKNLFCE